jgi:hypothetical protein
MKFTTVSIKEIQADKTHRLDAPYWIRLHSHNVLDKIRKKRESASHKPQAPSALKRTQLKSRIKI